MFNKISAWLGLKKKCFPKKILGNTLRCMQYDGCPDSFSFGLYPGNLRAFRNWIQPHGGIRTGDDAAAKKLPGKRPMLLKGPVNNNQNGIHIYIEA